MPNFAVNHDFLISCGDDMEVIFDLQRLINVLVFVGYKYLELFFISWTNRVYCFAGGLMLPLTSSLCGTTAL